MSHGARSSLFGLALCLALGIPAAFAQAPPSGTWTDPPARKPEAGQPAPEPSRATAPTPAAAPERPPSRTAPGSETETSRQPPRPAALRGSKPAPTIAAAPPRPARRATVRVEPPARTRVAVRPRPLREAPRVAARRLPPRLAAARPPQADRFAGYRGYGGGYPPRYGIAYPPGYADDRLERLREAEAAGYLVVRRRSVEFLDGRSLRTYRPLEDGGYD